MRATLISSTAYGHMATSGKAESTEEASPRAELTILSNSSASLRARKRAMEEVYSCSVARMEC